MRLFTDKSSCQKWLIFFFSWTTYNFDNWIWLAFRLSNDWSNCKGQCYRRNSTFQITRSKETHREREGKKKIWNNISNEYLTFFKNFKYRNIQCNSTKIYKRIKIRNSINLIIINFLFKKVCAISSNNPVTIWCVIAHGCSYRSYSFCFSFSFKKIEWFYVL